jgi:hypothetical protein
VKTHSRKRDEKEKEIKRNKEKTTNTNEKVNPEGKERKKYDARIQKREKHDWTR